MRTALALLLLAIGGAAHAAPPSGAGNPPVVVFLHAWIPELGPLETAPTATETEFLTMADQVRHGDIASATDLAEAMLAAKPDLRTRYLILLFRHETKRRFVQLAGGSQSISDDINLVRMIFSAQDHRDLNQARQIASSLGKEDTEQFEAIGHVRTTLESCLEQTLTYRYGTASNTMAAEIAKNTKDQDASCMNRASSFAEPGASVQRYAIDRALLTMLINSRMAIQARDDLQAAKAELRRGLELVRQNHWPAAESLWLLRQGDMEAAPRGSVLSFGYELAGEGNVRSDLGAGRATPRTTYDRRNVFPLEAAKFYDQAQRATLEGRTARPSDFAIRRALLKFLRGETAGDEFHHAAELAKGEHSIWNETMARTCAGLLLGSQVEFVSASKTAWDAVLPGAAVSMAELAMSWNQRAIFEGERIRAIDELRGMADALAGHGVDNSRAGILSNLSSLERDIGRSDASIESMNDALTAEKGFLAIAQKRQPEAARDAGFGEVVDESGVRLSIEGHLLELTTFLQMREVQEGQIAYIERRASVEKEEQEFRAAVIKDDPQLQGVFQALQAQTGQIDLKRLSAQIDHFKRLGTCPDILRAFSSSRSDLEHRTGVLPIVQGLILAGTCDPSLLDEARRKLSSLHPVDDARAALKQAPDPKSVERVLLFEPALDKASEWCYVADKADDGPLLEEWTSGLEQLPGATSAPNLPPQQLRYFHARALTIQGNSAEAIRVLSSLEADEPFWSYQARPDFRNDVLEARVEAEVNSGGGDAALLASERARTERERSGESSSGVTAQNPESAEAAMLLRRAALEGDLNKQRLAELQRTAAAGNEQFRLPTALDLQAGIKSLPSHTTALVYHPLRNELAIWRIDSGGKPRLIRVPVHAAELLRLAAEFRGRLAGEEAGWESSAERLYQFLIAPAGPIPADRTIAVVGIGRLGGIPLEALKDPQGHLQLTTNPVVYVSAIADTRRWPALAQQRTKSLVAGINAGGLTAPEAEAQAIATRLGTVALTGASATIARVREELPQARLIHFATHGVLDPTNPYRSYLALTDGPLEAWNIFRDIAGADLIVLSACDTSRGPRAYMAQTSSDESSISGFILRAGARRIVSSLWGATDSATKDLMEAFYKELERNPSDPAHALQLAKQSLLKPGRHPYAFTNFVLSVQNPGTIRLR